MRELRGALQLTESPHGRTSSARSTRCSDCGFWNEAGSARCERCGRRFVNRSRSLEARRELEEAGSVPEPPAGPPPLPQPEWKLELQRRVDQYRETRPPAELDSAELYAETADILSKDAELRPSVGRAAASGSSGPGLPPPKSQKAAPHRPVLPLPRKGEPLFARGGPAPPIVDPLGTAPKPRRRPRLTMAESSASLARRAAAAILDFAVVLLALGLFLAVNHVFDEAPLADPQGIGLLGVLFGGLLVFYWLLFLLYLGRTAGMAWLGLQVLNFDGEFPNAAQRRNRALGTLLSAASLGIGFAWAVADDQNLTWHDRISKTFVAFEPDSD
jgi:uncharacterized RDD family membrane protein YckC